MLKIFKLAIFDCELISVLNICPSASRQAINFLETIQTDIEKPFFEHRNEEVYQNIVAFAYAVDNYNRALNTRDHSVVSFYSVIDTEIDYLYQRIVALYSEICGANTLFADNSPIHIT